MLDRCPGSETRTLTPADRLCPRCGQEVEIWSDEKRARCPKCGTFIFREDAPSCADWCKSAAECLGKAGMKKGMSHKD